MCFPTRAKIQFIQNKFLACMYTIQICVKNSQCANCMLIALLQCWDLPYLSSPWWSLLNLDGHTVFYTTPRVHICLYLEDPTGCPHGKVVSVLAQSLLCDEQASQERTFRDLGTFNISAAKHSYSQVSSTIVKHHLSLIIHIKISTISTWLVKTNNNNNNHHHHHKS
jgi:hypothetical protein